MGAMIRITKFFLPDDFFLSSPRRYIPCVQYKKVSWVMAAVVRVFGKRYEIKWAPEWMIFRTFRRRLYEEDTLTEIRC